jgi:methylenetetrahydrofolate reductase (NADPH)
MSYRGTVSPSSVPGSAVEEGAIVALARRASVEMTWRHASELPACRSLLAPGTCVFASHLPSQTWLQSIDTCAAIRQNGFEPVPHVPVRQLIDAAALERLAADLAKQAGVRQVLLIAGDSPRPVGEFSATLDALRTGVLAAHGIRSVFVAGHPEGHPSLTAEDLRRAERDKVEFAATHGLELSFLTQFFFDAAPFLAWARGLRAQGVQTRLVAGLAGPARLTTLFKYAVRCGVGPSIRALGARPSSFARLAAERGPESIVRALARVHGAGEIEPLGIHLFSFGGLAHTCAWLRAVAEGRFTLDDAAGFKVA